MQFSDIVIQGHSNVDLLSYLRTTLRDHGIQFTYTHDYDQQGIIYWLGTKQGKLKHYVKPKSVLVTLERNRQVAENHEFLNRYGVCFMQWHSKPYNIKITMNFAKGLRIKPKYYTLGYIKDGNGFCILRNWKLLGSIDGNRWETLREHIKDESITQYGEKASWPIESNVAYKYFRIERTGPVSGPESESSQMYTAVSGFELYGTVYKSH